MFKLFCVFLLMSFPLFAGTSSISKETRKSYAQRFYEAFSLQANGKSTLAAFQFETACQEAIKTGENAQKIQILKQLFCWYRTYGSTLGLFFKKPTGTDIIIGEYRTYSSMLKTNRYQGSDYHSEWGKTPEQAGKVREFMLGIGETISGIFSVAVGSPFVAGGGYFLALDGVRRMYLSLNSLWVEHERALIEFKKWEESVKAVEFD